MASFTWSAGTSGNWSDPANWTPSGVPGAGDTATVSAAGSYVVQIDVPAIGSLILDAPDATIDPVGSFALSGLLDLKAGTFSVNDTITGGTIRPDGGTIAYNGGTFDGVILDGPLDLSAEGAFINIADGISFASPAPEQILLTGYDSDLGFRDADTLNNVAITTVSTSYLDTGPGLTLGASSTLTIDDVYTAPRSAFFGTAITGMLLDNKGSITVDGPLDDIATTTVNEGSFLVEAGNTSQVQGALANTGALQVSGGNVELTVGGVLTNSGSVSLAADSSLVLDGGLANSGSITLASGATLYVNGDTSFDQLGSIARNGGTIDIGSMSYPGSFDLSGQTLHVTAGGEFDGTQFAEDIGNGTIELDGGAATFTSSAEGYGTVVDLDVSETYDQFGSNGYLFGATVEIGKDATLDLTDRTLHVATGYNFGGEFDDLTLAGTVTGGTIELDGGAITYAGGTLDGVTLDGPLDLDTQGASLTIGSSGLAFAGTSPEQISIAGASLTFQHAETLDNADVVLGDGSDLHLLGAPLTLGATTTVSVTGAVDVNGNIDNHGTIDVTTGSFPPTAEFVSMFHLVNDGALVFDGSGYNSIDLMNDAAGTVVLSNGAVLAPDTITNAGTIQISTGATLQLASTVVNLGTVTFVDGRGTLAVPFGAEAYGTLAGFERGDAILLQTFGQVPTLTLTHTGNTLDLSGDGNIDDRFALVGQDYTDANFTLSQVDEGFTITTDAPCFCAGTLILTDRGERPVESLQVGDLVVTRRNGIDTLMPVRWIGQRRLHVARHPEPEQVAPVRIGRDAVAPGVPCRDLRVSPDHAVFLDDLLIQARQLVNGMTIRRDLACTVVTYHHVELDQHAILVADGLACESYLDTGNRAQFDNNAIVALHGRVDPRDGHAGCVPLATDAALVRPVWDRLADRAAARGHARPDLVVTHDPALRLHADGMPIEPTDAANGLIRFHLPPGCQEVRLRSGSDRPTTLSPWCDDRRRLGIALSAITLRQGAWRQDLSLDQLPADAGWWPVESAGALSWRWSNGDALITLPEPGDTLDIALHAVMPVAVLDPSGAERQPAQAGIER